jgi:hypothetical protein
MEIEAVKSISGSELAAWRRKAARDGRQRAVSTARPGSALPEGVVDHGDAVQGPGRDVYMTKPKRMGHRRDAHDVRDAVTDRRLAGILAGGAKDPEFVKALAHKFREKNPEIGNRMTDMEIITLSLGEASELATERAFKKIGRGVHQ